MQSWVELYTSRLSHHIDTNSMLLLNCPKSDIWSIHVSNYICTHLCIIHIHKQLRIYIQHTYHNTNTCIHNVCMYILYNVCVCIVCASVCISRLTVVSRAAKQSRTSDTTVCYIHERSILIERSLKACYKNLPYEKTTRVIRTTSYY